MTDQLSYQVAVTGIGICTALGRDAEETWSALIEGKVARRKIQIFDTEGCRCHEAAEIGLPPAAPRSKKSRASRLAIAPAKEALKQAGLWSDHGNCTYPTLPLSLSTTAGGMEFGENFLKRILKKNSSQRLVQVARYQPQQQVLDLQEELGLCGPSLTIANACAGGANAIGHAADLIRSGIHTQILAGGFEALTQLVYFGFDSLQSLSPHACRPFDEERDGLMLGEGAAFLVLENVEFAKARKAEVLCYLTGYAHETDLTHLTQPQPEGKVIASVVSRAMQQAKIAPNEIAYLNAHGTATPMNDGAEALAYKTCFKKTLPRISSTKAAIGHTLGAAGAVEAVFSILALRSGQLPPQCLTTHPLPDIASALCRLKEHHPHPQHVMSVNLGFGGSHAALIFSKSIPSPKHPTFRAHPSPSMAVLSAGAVCPSGISVSSLLSPIPKESSLSLLSHKNIQMPVFRIDLENENLKKWRRHPRLRRSSPLSLFMAEAANQALSKTDETIRSRMGMVAAFGTGCHIYSRKFYGDILQNGRRGASPLLFPETVFNSPTSHIASIFGISGPCYSLVGDESAWAEALRVAQVWLKTKTVDYVLVLGAEELDISAVETYRLFRWFEKDSQFRPSEGAAALLIGSSSQNETFLTIDPYFPSIPYRQKQQALKILNTYTEALSPEAIIYQEEGHSWLARDISRVFSKFKNLGTNCPYQGEAFVASAGWQTLRALHTPSPHSPIHLPIIGSNHAITGLKIHSSSHP